MVNEPRHGDAIKVKIAPDSPRGAPKFRSCRALFLRYADVSQQSGLALPFFFFFFFSLLSCAFECPHDAGDLVSASTKGYGEFLKLWNIYECAQFRSGVLSSRAGKVCLARRGLRSRCRRRRQKFFFQRCGCAHTLWLIKVYQSSAGEIAYPSAGKKSSRLSRGGLRCVYVLSRALLSEKDKLAWKKKRLDYLGGSHGSRLLYRLFQGHISRASRFVIAFDILHSIEKYATTFTGGDRNF